MKKTNQAKSGKKRRSTLAKRIKANAVEAPSFAYTEAQFGSKFQPMVRHALMSLLGACRAEDNFDQETFETHHWSFTDILWTKRRNPEFYAELAKAMRMHLPLPKPALKPTRVVEIPAEILAKCDPAFSRCNPAPAVVQRRPGPLPQDRLRMRLIEDRIKLLTSGKTESFARVRDRMRALKLYTSADEKRLRVICRDLHYPLAPAQLGRKPRIQGK